MSHVFEPSPSGRAKCRGCNEPIAKDAVRFGERLPNPFADGEMTLWFHPACAAWKRPAALLEALAATAASVPDRPALEVAAKHSAAHRRLPRLDGAERAPSGRASCRHCHAPIERNTWRIRLVFFEEGRFAPGGYVHLACRSAYFETDDVLAPLLHFSPALAAAERDELARACSAGADAGPSPG